MYYKIFSENPKTHFIDIECTLKNILDNTLELQLPAWRPGRYELQNFAKNIQRFEVFDKNGKKLDCQKIKKDRWKINTLGIDEIFIKYNYYANVQNAGSSYVDENLLYINPVNLCVYAEGSINEECFLCLQMTDNEKVTLSESLFFDSKNNTKVFRFNSFYHLADSPFIKSTTLQLDSFSIGKTQFNIWFEGVYKPDFERIKTDFEKFSQAQINVFGAFPEADYHFITWVLPTPFYHGVEHRNSTMMVLGLSSDNDTEEFYTDLLGLASHELFHAWNICKIRPIELLPYDFTQENYFKTCFVAEGVTTYYGDLMLHRSGVFDDKQYQKELEVRYKQHFENSGKAFQSLTDSSYDLWLDGYTQGIPDRKVSVYHKGAIAAQILDVFIQKTTQNNKSLDDVMYLMYEKFGKTQNGEPTKGYALEDYKTTAEAVAGCSLDWYFEECIFGNMPLQNRLNDCLEMLDLKIELMALSVVSM